MCSHYSYESLLENIYAKDFKISLCSGISTSGRKEDQNQAGDTTASSSSSTTSRQLPKITEKKPPLTPTRSMGMPLRRITNFMSQQPFQGPTKRFSDATSKENHNNNTNNSRIRSSSVDINTLMKPRRSSIAFRPAPPLAIASGNNNKTLQPRKESLYCNSETRTIILLHKHSTTPCVLWWWWW